MPPPPLPAVPGVELSTQALFVHCWLDPHTCPQLPQFALLVVVSMQLEKHSIWPPGQPHEPALQT